MSLVLFFTSGVSLQTWNNQGILLREIELYKRLLPRVGKITFITYGDSKELEYADLLGDIRLLYNRWGLPIRRYESLAPILHMRSLLGSTLLKTNQTSGAKAALPVQQWFRKKLIVRCGFMWSLNAARTYGEGTEATLNVLRQEHKAFTSADKIVVTTSEMKNYAIDRHQIEADKVSIIPNFVDVESQSSEDPPVRNHRTVCYVGRLVPEKNVGALVDAVAGVDAKLLILGDGPERKNLETRAERNGSKVHFLGTIPFPDVSRHIRSSNIFVLPSLWEGQPKALMEAMATGTAVIGADSPGIRDLITNGENGLLCRTSAESIRESIVALLNNDDFRTRLAKNGREYIKRNFSLNHVVDMEIELYEALHR